MAAIKSKKWTWAGHDMLRADNRQTIKVVKAREELCKAG